jgi:hypothetical protein
VGTVKQLSIMSESCQLSLQLDGNVFGQRLDFAVFDDNTNYWELFDLMNLKEREFSVEMKIDNVFVFRGFLLAETAERKLLRRNNIQLTASAYISKLKNYQLTHYLNDKDLVSPMGIICEILLQTGKDLPINVNSSIYPQGMEMASNENALEKVGVQAQNFYKNNAETENSYDILQQILFGLDLYLYFFQDQWYIERYEDIGKTNKTYIRYNINGTKSVWNVVENTIPFSGYTQLNQTQTLITETGYNQLILNLKQKTKSGWNLAPYNKDKISSTPYSVSTAPNPTIFHWMYQTGTISNATLNYFTYTKSFFNINNPIRLYVSNLIDEDILYSNNSRFKGVGFSTKIRTSFDENDSKLTVKFKWTNGMQNYGTGHWRNPTTKNYRIYYTVRNPRFAGAILIANRYIKHDAENDTWSVIEATAEYGANYIEITPDQVNQATGIYEGEINIPLSDVTGIVTGDNLFVISLNYVTFKYESSSTTKDLISVSNIYGDIEISTNSPADDNQIVADITDDFITSKTYEMLLHDNKYSSNAFYHSLSEYAPRTTAWTCDNLFNKPLAEQLIFSKMKLLNKNRVSLHSDVRTNDFLKPLAIHEQNIDGQNIKFVLNKYVHNVQTNKYQIELKEYNNTDQINLTYND